VAWNGCVTFGRRFVRRLVLVLVDVGARQEHAGAAEAPLRGWRALVVEGPERRSEHWAREPAAARETGRDLEGRKQTASGKRGNRELGGGKKGKEKFGRKRKEAAKAASVRSPATAAAGRAPGTATAPPARRLRRTRRRTPRGPPLAARRPANRHAQHTAPTRSGTKH
jgi:hypothetical protein